MKHMVLENAKSRSSPPPSKRWRVSGFVMCVDNTDYVVALEIGKVYRTLKIARNAPPNWIRVVDESGEDYLYLADRFIPIEVSARGKRAIAMAGR